MDDNTAPVEVEGMMSKEERETWRDKYASGFELPFHQLFKSHDACERALREALAGYHDKEPCGHPKNFLIGDDYGHFTCTVCRITSLESERDAALARLNDLLAVIHRDGGHYAHEHGVEKAAKDAEGIVFGLMARITVLETALQSLVSKLRLIHDDSRYKSVWTFYAIHGMRYDGPQYERELIEADEALAHQPEQASLVLRCHGCTGTVIYKRHPEIGEIEIFHSCACSHPTRRQATGTKEQAK